MVSKKVKIWGGVAAAVIVIGGIANLVNPQEKPDLTPAPTVAAPSPSVKPSPSKTADKAATQEEIDAFVAENASKPIAKDFEKAWLENMMVDSPTELLSTMPNSLAGYVNGFEDVASDTIEITVQKNDVSKADLKAQAQSMFSLVGSDFPELQRVEVVSADRLTRGVSNRRDVPLLNQ